MTAWRYSCIWQVGNLLKICVLESWVDNLVMCQFGDLLQILGLGALLEICRLGNILVGGWLQEILR